MSQRSSSRYPLVSIVVLSSRPLELSSPIYALNTSTYPASRIELLLLNKSRSPHDKKILKKLRSRSVQTAFSSSKAALFSQVLKQVRGELVLFISDDCKPDKKWIREMVSAFQRDKRIGVVFGETQWRKGSDTDKIGQYCEQIGLGSIAQHSALMASAYLSPNGPLDPLDISLGKVVAFLTLNNCGIKSYVLKELAKRPGEGFFTSDKVRYFDHEKIRLFYQGKALVEKISTSQMKKLDEYLDDSARRSAAWLAAKPLKTLDLQVRLFGEHDISLPFFISANISWGDFHWMHLFGIWALIQTVELLFLSPLKGMGDMDTLLLFWSFFGYFGFRYFLPVLKVQPWSNFILWCWIRYRSNMSMFLKGLWRGLQFKTFYWSESW